MDGAPEQSSGAANSTGPSWGHAVGATTNPILWTDELHADFCQAIEQCGGPLVARPKNIKANMRSDSVTTTQIKSHLQRHRQRLLAMSATESPAVPLAAGGAAAGPLSSSGILAARPQALPGWYSPGDEEPGSTQAFKRPRPEPQLTSSLATFQAMFAQQPQQQQQQQQQQQFDPLVMQAVLIQERGEAAHPFYPPPPPPPPPQQQQGQPHLARPTAISAFQWGPSWGHTSPMAGSQLPHVQRAPAGLGAGSSLPHGRDSLGRMAGWEIPGNDPAMHQHQHQHQHQHSQPLAAPAFAAWLGAVLAETQGMGGVLPPSGSGAGGTMPALAALAAASGGSAGGDGSSGAAPQAGREGRARATEGPEVQERAQGEDGADDGSSTMSLLHQMALLAAQQYNVQQEIGEHMQALHGLHIKLDSLAAQMLEAIARHYAQFARNARAQPTPGPSAQAEREHHEQQPQQQQQQQQQRPRQRDSSPR